jgi:predicted dehydrogenase
MLRVGIIGCGNIADQHAESLMRIPYAKIAGACDSEALMAKQFSERFNVKYYFSDVTELLEISSPDVVHITTPPQSHFELGRICLEAGSHVYIEKPFTLNTLEAIELLKIAHDKKLKITVGHNTQFTHAAIYMRKLINEGFLGGPPVHLESYFCYNFEDETYAKALLGDKNHWVRKLPGKLLHNIISHGISKIVEFITTENPKVIAHGFTSPLLKSINENDIIDELRIIINDNENTTAFFTFSSQIMPVLKQFRIYGPKNSLIVDEANQTVIKVGGKSYKSYLNHFFPPFVYAKEYLSNNSRNIKKFLKNDFHNDSGMKRLIELFYFAILNRSPLPISHDEIIATSKIMDAIFEQIYNKNLKN